MIRNAVKLGLQTMRAALCRTPGVQALERTPGAGKLYRDLLWRRGGINQFWGVFDSQEEALQAAPLGLRLDWDDAALHGFLRGQPSIAHSLRWIAQRAAPGSLVLDFGGQLGALFYAAQSEGLLPEQIHWLVVDVPTAVEKGRAQALHRGERRLQFRADVPAGLAPDFVVAAGAVQYVFSDFASFLQALGTPPPAMLLNKLSLNASPSFWTLQNQGASVTPYRIYNETAYLAEVAAAGYEIRERWPVDEIAVDIPFRPDLRVPRLAGLMLERRA